MVNRNITLLLGALSLIAGLTTATPLVTQADDDSIVVYSARKQHLIQPLFDQYTAQTGVKIKYITDKAGPLLARLQAEGAATPADMLLTVDAGNLWQAAQAGVLQQINHAQLQENIPSAYRDPANHWFGLSLRARTIAYNTNNVKPKQLSTYADLSASNWQGKLCLRTSKKVYNQSLVAMMIERLGETKTESIVKGWVNNLAIAPFSNDTRALEAIAAGQCDVTIVNTYYFGRLLADKPTLPIKLFWPNQANGGTHVNISGAGITKHAKHKDAAVKLLLWLSSPEAQAVFASVNLEYPTNPTVAKDPQVDAWGTFIPDSTNLAIAGQRQAQAVKLMQRAGYR